MSLTIAELDLAPVMERRARELELAFPGQVTFVSGRRTLHEQAAAMAANHLLDPGGYLVRNYFHAAELLYDLTQHPDADTIEEVTEVFFQRLTANPDLVKSPHLTGDAVDLRRMEQSDGTPTVPGQAVIAWIQVCPDTVDFRMREGTLRRWHWQTAHSVEV
jgi:hypothetical protein